MLLQGRNEVNTNCCKFKSFLEGGRENIEKVQGVEINF